MILKNLKSNSCSSIPNNCCNIPSLYGLPGENGEFLVENLFSEITTEYQRLTARQNLGVSDGNAIKWGNVGGNILNQADLKQMLDSKADKSDFDVTLGGISNVDEEVNEIKEQDMILVKKKDNNTWTETSYDEITLDLKQELDELRSSFYEKFPFDISSFYFVNGSSAEKIVDPDTGENINEVSLNVKWAYSRNSNDIQQSIVGGLEDSIIDYDKKEAYIGKTTVNKSVTLNAELDGLKKSRTITFSFKGARYCGIVQSEITNESQVKSLSKITFKDTRAHSYTGQVNGKLCYCYPKSYSKLDSIKDAAGTNYKDTFSEKSSIYVDGEEYYIYTMINPAYTGSDNVTIIFS